MGINSYRLPRWRLRLRVAFAVIGIIVGISASASFALKFMNYHVAGWAPVSSLFAALALVLHLKVWSDITYSITPKAFKKVEIIGILGAGIGFVVFVVYLLKGILAHESGVQVDGWFIVTVWGFMIWKWGFLLFWYAHGYKRSLLASITGIISGDDDKYSINE